MARKSVLIIDESDLFRDYLRGRIADHNVDVDTAINGLDGMVKMRSLLPDLVILDYNLTRKTCKEVLEEKSRNPNTAAIPVILTAQQIDKNRLLELVPYNIRKVFMKPIKMDGLYGTLAELLGQKFPMDETPCIIEAHVNDNIVFIEIAKGLNREKVELLRFKIAELLALYQIRNPRILVMISDMELSFVDGPNVELLLTTILSQSRAKPKHLKILTAAPFVKDYVKGQEAFAEVEVLANLQYAIDGLLTDYDPTMELGELKGEMIADRILAANAPAAGGESIEMRFSSEGPKPLSLEAMREMGRGLSIAVVDDDFVIQELVKTTFGAMHSSVSAFSGGQEFLDVAASTPFDLVFLDILMPGMNGFQVLASLHAQDIDLPIIILSAVSHRDAVVKAFQAGVKSYLIKPLKPDQIMKKTLEILKANF